MLTAGHFYLYHLFFFCSLGCLCIQACSIWHKSSSMHPHPVTHATQNNPLQNIVPSLWPPPLPPAVPNLPLPEQQNDLPSPIPPVCVCVCVCVCVTVCV